MTTLPDGYAIERVFQWPQYQITLIAPDGTRQAFSGKWREQEEQAVKWAWEREELLAKEEAV